MSSQIDGLEEYLCRVQLPAQLAKHHMTNIPDKYTELSMKKSEETGIKQCSVLFNSHLYKDQKEEKKPDLVFNMLEGVVQNSAPIPN